MTSVVITRPSKQARALAQRIEGRGREVVLFPLLEIRPLKDPTAFRAILGNLSRYTMVVFVSPNAIDATFSYLSVWPNGPLAAVMGLSSRDTLIQYGFEESGTQILCTKNPDQTGSEGLLEAIKNNFSPLPDNREILIIRGETGRELLADSLQADGWKVTQIAGYSRQAILWDAEKLKQLRDLLTSENDWFITSSEALDVLVQGMKICVDESFVLETQRQNIWASHFRIVQRAEQMGFKNVTWIGSGDDQWITALQLQ